MANPNGSDPDLDKKLEARLFDLLEVRARIPLGQLSQLRRRSRSARITLLEAALQAERITPDLARALAAEAGPGAMRTSHAVTPSPPSLDATGETGEFVAAPPPPAAPAPATAHPPPFTRAESRVDAEPSPASDELDALEDVPSIADLGVDDLELLDDHETGAHDAIPDADADLFDFSDLERELADHQVQRSDPSETSTGMPALGTIDHDDPSDSLIDAAPPALDDAFEVDIDPEEPSGPSTDPPRGAGPVTEVAGSAGHDTPWKGDTSPPQGAVASAPEDVGLPIGAAANRRYALGRELGRGGMGLVLEAEDLVLGRPVALKLLIDQDDASLRLRFTDEARVTGQLQHPSIPPVYELGRLGDGRLYFAMRRIEGRTLRDVIEDLRTGDPEIEKQFGPVRLLNLFAQICRAIAYAHARGVIHRDLKPDNVMFGAFGEVTVMDWGLAKPVGMAEVPVSTARARAADAQDARYSTQYGEVTGTPQYMPPEQAAGRIDELGTHSDVYSLGAMLYELLTLEPPFDGPSARAIRDAVVHTRVSPPSERAPNRAIPHAMEQLCLHCLAKEPKKRPRTAAWVADQIDDYLEGEQDRARKEQERRRLHELGRVAAERWLEDLQGLQKQQARTAQLRARLAPWAPVEERDKVWRQEDHEQQARVEAARHLSEALVHFHGALGAGGETRATRTALAEVYFAAFENAERDRDQAAAAQYENLVRAFDDEGLLKHRLKGDGKLEIETLPRGLAGTLSVYRVVDRVLTPSAPQAIAALPTRIDPLPMGSYLLKLSAPGLSESYAPLLVSRQESVKLRLRVFPDAAVGRGFVHIHGGPARVGGDPLAQLATPLRTVEVADFFIARRPVTCGEYAEFLRDVYDTSGPVAAAARAPRNAPQAPSLWPAGPQGAPVPPGHDSSGQPWHPEWPVVGISAEDADAYCAWKTRQSGQLHRLPTDIEWEKSARGADGRLFPWGDAFEPTFCHMGLSRSGAPARGPSGMCPIDKSPYGVEDLAGSVSEWTSTWLDETSRQRVVKGGHWASGPTECRAASRFAQPATAVLGTLGFRVARDAPA
ncbi:MAG: SUMF1/EgtB/PvdO family nonheme iron enzyme [Bradymonadia bacterium]